MIQRRRRTAPTLEIVAARAGVSRATAGRVLTGGKTSVQARSRVLAAADDLGYVPNQAARALVTRRSHCVALVAADDDRAFADPYFAALLRGVQAAVAANGLQLVFMATSDDAGRKRLVNHALGGHLDGVILAWPRPGDPLPDALIAAGVPVVSAGRAVGGRFSVDSDNLDAAAAAVSLLAARGCRRIATITGPMVVPAAQDRVSGYRRGLADVGLMFDQMLVVAGDFGADSGAAAMLTLLRRAPEVDGVFAASDLMAMGALRVLAEAGRSVPGDVAVIGFDDIASSSQSMPPLTTVRQDTEEVGRQLALGLIAAIAGNPAPDPVVVPTRLVLRASA